MRGSAGGQLAGQAAAAAGTRPAPAVGAHPAACQYQRPCSSSLHTAAAWRGAGALELHEDAHFGAGSHGCSRALCWDLGQLCTTRRQCEGLIKGGGGKRAPPHLRQRPLTLRRPPPAEEACRLAAADPTSLRPTTLHRACTALQRPPRPAGAPRENGPSHRAVWRFGGGQRPPVRRVPGKVRSGGSQLHGAGSCGTSEAQSSQRRRRRRLPSACQPASVATRSSLTPSIRCSRT